MDHSPTETLKDRKLVVEALVECLVEGDLPAMFEIIEAHYQATNTDRALKRAKVAKNTYYDALKKKDTRLSTFAKILKGLNLGSPKVEKRKAA